ncbi:MAG: hypothetical protein EHM20_09370 [Alphaproteobacteria bacterium]|nr:MAG: hypothetical protein EHM20_09370 [Alphaproteobacteria bacterium]
MKTGINCFIITVLFAGAIVASCKKSSTDTENARKKVREAKTEVAEAQENLQQARIAAYEEFKKEYEAKIDENEKSIAELKVKIANETISIQEKLNMKLDKLEQKNNEMKRKLSGYVDEGEEKWISFKNEFENDMEELGEAFKQLTVNNVN